MAEGVDGGSYARSSSHHLHQHDEPLLCGSTTVAVSEEEYRADLWGYPVHTRSDSCVSFINEFYRQVYVWNSPDCAMRTQEQQEEVIEESAQY